MIFYILITLCILFFSYKKPIYALVMILNINSIRALPKLDLNHLAFRVSNEGDFYMSVLLPFIAYAIILFKIDWKNKRVKYLFDSIDLFFIASIIIMIVYCFIAPNIVLAINYTVKYLLIGTPLYYMSKIVLFNSHDTKAEYQSFFKAIIVASILIGNFGFLLAYSVDFFDPTLGSGTEWRIARVTIPGVHPIPFSQAIGFGSLICFAVFYTNGVVLNLRKRKYVLLYLFLFFYLFFLTLVSNTRGVLVALFVSILFFILLYPRKISKKNARRIFFILIIGVIISINYIDFKTIFNRLLNSFDNDASFSERKILLTEAFHIMFTNPVGVGTGGFIYGYPHNIFLDYIVSFGIFGWMLSFSLLAIIIYFFGLTFNNRKKHPTLVLLYCIIIYFFIETLISFTLWMHKGFYLSLGLFIIYMFVVKNIKKKQKIERL